MTDDLVTRLRTLAAVSYRLTTDEPEALAMLQAAEALERAHTLWDHETKRADDLKAKLAMGMQSIDSAWKVSYQKAAAEAAALREALEWYRANASDAGLPREFMRTPTRERAIQALSQTGPGAALLERLESEKTRADLAEERADKLVDKNDVLTERVKKLEHALQLIAYDEHPCIANWQNTALTALEETP